MMFSSRLASIGLCICLCAAFSAPVSAQGFFQSLFGGFSEPKPRSTAPANPYGDGRYSPYGVAYPFWMGEAPRPRTVSRYRAVCVRTCDGYYWPLTSRARRSDLHDLAEQCSESCDGGARLFYLPANSTDIANMQDMAGRRYGALEAAFLYRKKYISACRCKPQPWSVAERARHQQYAYEEKRRDDAADGKGPARNRTTVERLDDLLEDDDVAQDVEQASLVESEDGAAPAWNAEAAPAESAERPKPRSQRRSAQRPAYRVRARVSRAASNSSGQGWFGGGQQKHVWPGDAGYRRR